MDRGRILWLDCAKGIAIILVVAGHAAGGLIDVRTMQPPHWLTYLFFVIYTFHMPCFFFLSALLIHKRVLKDRNAFVTSLGRRIVYPYFLWSVIQLTVIFLAASLVNSPINEYWSNLLAIAWWPISQFWFLYVLAIFYVLSLLLLPIMRPAMFLAVLTVISLLEWHRPIAGPLGLTGQYALFYGLGVVIGPRAGALVAALKGWQKLAAAMMFVAVMVGFCRLEVTPLLAATRPDAATIARMAWQPHLLPAALIGGLFVLILAVAATGRLLHGLSVLGRASMAIYLTHIILMAGSRIVIGRVLGPIDATIVLLLLVAIGIGGSMAVQAVAKRLGVARILALQ